MRSFTSSLAVIAAFGFLAGCRTDPLEECTTRRVWIDSLGESDERARIQVQWVRIQGGGDSLASTVEGKALLDRAAGSLVRNETRYSDSVVGGESGGRSHDGCVDWKASWATGSFDRQAMATVLLRRLTPDSGFGAVEFRLDTTGGAMVLSVDASPGESSSDRNLRTHAFGIDSMRIEWLRR